MSAPAPVISPDTVTTRQVLGSFTGKHWVTAITTVFAALASVAGGGFWAGKQISNAQAETAAAKFELTLAKKESELGEAKAELKASAARIQQYAEANAAWASANQITLNELAQQRQEIVALSTALGKANNCTFIHEQIRSINVQLQSTGSTTVFSDSEEWRRKQAERKTALESQLAGYQQQLGGCNK